ncbi:hypothetical protein ND748_03090 [Frankia sp. AiPs1]|uniref:hypothetical protein n=1 Tax=Frankia sp. AiPs1 TaxID=573493 RepID=UPI002044C57D|nr:hypothetical protein [Frankia sp. AiPs1]MCM3920662.1 hypothetical protein [Frankia sp. AiPs1]
MYGYVPAATDVVERGEIIVAVAAKGASSADSAATVMVENSINTGMTFLFLTGADDTDASDTDFSWAVAR